MISETLDVEFLTADGVRHSVTILWQREGGPAPNEKSKAHLCEGVARLIATLDQAHV